MGGVPGDISAKIGAAPSDDGPGLDHMGRLLSIMAALRDPDSGCPWDCQQDFASIAPYTIEEAYEVADAIACQNWAELRSELGDLLLQVVFHARIAQERGLFDFAAVAAAIADKMVARHPHVFGEAAMPGSVADQALAWEATKAAERSMRGGGTLDGVARALPALSRAQKLQDRAARVGFDWPNPERVLDKIVEEAQELVAARRRMSASEMSDEMGDLFFAMANLARHLGIDPEAALRATNDKFTRRFAHIESSLAQQGRTLLQTSLEDMEMLWNDAKQREKRA